MEQNTNTPEQTTLEQVKTDEIAINANGEVVFLEQEQAETAPEATPTQDSDQGTPKSHYTLEEFKEVAAQGFEKLDPNRIPEELIPYYKSMQADYTRKTQQVAQQRKELEQMQKEVQEQIRLAEIQANYQVPRDVLLSAVQTAKQKAAAQLNINDEYSPEFQQAQSYFLSETINNYKQQIAAQQRLQAAENYLRRADGENFSKIEQYALYLIENELTAKELRAIEAAKATGDPLPLLNLYDRARQALFGAEQNKSAVVKQEVKPVTTKSAQPPIIESAGGEIEQQTKKVVYKPSDFAGKNTIEQTRMLIEMGII